MAKSNIDIYGLLKNGKHEEIRKHLMDEVYKMATYCSQVIGEGFFGKVTVPVTGPAFSVKIDDEYIIMPIVVKEAKNVGNVYMDDIDNTLIISSDMSLSCEAIMLYILSKFWYKGLNLHLPYMIGIGNCNPDNKLLVTNIISERHGLFHQIEINYQNYIRTPMHLNQMNKDMRYSYLASVGDLFEYILVNYDDKFMCKLENNINVYLPDLIDQYCIFYLHTSDFLWKNLGMTLSDQHAGNIFVHWINSMSRCGKKSLTDLKNIYYEIGKNKYLKIPVNGLIFKIGDIGTCFMKIQDSVMIVGDLANSRNLNYVTMYKKKYNLYLESMEIILGMFPLEILTKTKIYKILLKNKYLARHIYIGFRKQDNINAPTELEILNDDIYSDFFSKDYKDDNQNFVVFNEREI
jgi:hypothetical protein